MTVAIACAFQDGVLFCADTKITTGQEKAHESKIYTHQWGYEIKNCVTVFTLAGAVHHASAAIEKCERAIAKLDFDRTSLSEMQDAIEVALADFYQRHIFPNPNRSEVGFDLLIGLWLNGETRTLSTEGTALKTVYGYDCVGSGGYLARYWLQEALGPSNRFQSETLTLPEASLIIEHAINSAVEYDDFCGGEVEFMGMRSTGEINEIGDLREGAYLSDFPEQLRSATWGLLRRLAKTNEIFEQEIAVDEFCDTVRELHKPVVSFLKEFVRLKAARDAAFSAKKPGED